METTCCQCKDRGIGFTAHTNDTSGEVLYVCPQCEDVYDAAIDAGRCDREHLLTEISEEGYA